MTLIEYAVALALFGVIAGAVIIDRVVTWAERAGGHHQTRRWNQA